MVTNMRFGLRIPPCYNVRRVAKFVKHMEDAGWSQAWITDAPLQWRDLYITLTACALETSSIQLGSSVTNPITRHPAVTANAALSLDEVSDGRMILGIGLGASAIWRLGLKTPPVGQLRQAIVQMRALFDGKFFVQEDRILKMIPAENRGRRVPIYVVGARPRMLQLAGEVGDGAILATKITDDAIEEGLAYVREGAKKSGQTVETKDLVLHVQTVFADDISQGLRLARPLAAHHAGGYSRNLPPMSQAEIYPDISHAQDWDRAMKAAEFVTDSEVMANAFVGKPRDFVEFLEKVKRHGIESVYLKCRDSYGLPENEARMMEEVVIPSFA